MRKSRIILLLIISFSYGCRKIDIDKSEKQILGKWETVDLVIGGKIIHYGFKTMFGRTIQSDPDYFISITYLVLRFNIIKW